MVDAAVHALGSGDQLNFFDAETVSIDESFSTARRIWLDPECWIDFVPGWLSGSPCCSRHCGTPRMGTTRALDVHKECHRATPDSGVLRCS